MSFSLDVVGSILGDYKRDHGLRAAAGPTVGDDIPIKTRLLHPYVEQRGMVDKVHLYSVPVETTHIIAQVQTYTGAIGAYNQGDIANIYFAENHNLCWRRFAVCKEMYHCMIDRLPAYRVHTLETLKTLLGHLAMDTTSVTGTFPPLDSEQAAELFALETLFPLEVRLHHQADYENARLTDTNLAEMYRIPAQYVPIGFQPNYMATIKALRGKLHPLDT